MTEVRRTAAPPAQLDHLVLAATTLADGIDFIAEVTDSGKPPITRYARVIVTVPTVAPLASMYRCPKP